MMNAIRRRQLLIAGTTAIATILLKACDRAPSVNAQNAGQQTTTNTTQGTQTMKILALLNVTDAANPERIKPHIVPENKMVWELYKSGLIREMYFRADSKGAVLVLEAPELPKAEAVMQDLPMVKEGLLIVQLIQLNPFTQLEFAFR